ncbi:MAG TPA: MraY family glycosyltransferase [bacterium]|nr:MraY family glycosyltransferase [bacterium]
MTYLYALLVAFLLSVFGTKILIRIGYKFGIVSKPRKRDIHQKPVPRIGGLAIFGAFILTVLAFSPMLSDAFGQKHFVGILLGGLVITAAMLLDDLRGLKAWQKLFFQAFATVIVVASGIGIDHLANPFGDPINLNSIYVPILTYQGVTYHFSLLSDFLTLAWMIGMMNIINFVDGVDGLAGGLSSIALYTIFSLSLAVGQPATALLSIILLGSTLGFLKWNFPPAKIFMGDTGSMFLGFMLGVLPLLSGGKLATVFLVLGFPIVDGLFVAVGRLIRRQNPFTTPDKTHLHHRFLVAGFTPRQAILSLYFIAAAFGWVALRASTGEKMVASVILVILLLGLIWYLRNKAQSPDSKAKIKPKA